MCERHLEENGNNNSNNNSVKDPSFRTTVGFIKEQNIREYILKMGEQKGKRRKLNTIMELKEEKETASIDRTLANIMKRRKDSGINNIIYMTPLTKTTMRRTPNWGRRL